MTKATAPLLMAAALLGAACVRAEVADPKVAAQQKAAQKNWALLEAGEPAHHETAHLLIYAPKPLEGRLPEIGTALEKHYAAAAKALQLDPKKELWPGKLTVYLFAERGLFTAFIRRVEKRRLEAEETSGHAVEGDTPHVFAGPPRAKPDANPDLPAAEEVAIALLQRKAGPKVILPEWLVFGFGRATTWRNAPREAATIRARKEAVALLVNKQRTAEQVWTGAIEPEEGLALRPALAELLAYGPGTTRFAAFVVGFRPDDGQERRTTEEALEAAGLKAANVEKVWPDFVRSPR